jgi:hypothetical protein
VVAELVSQADDAFVAKSAATVLLVNGPQTVTVYFEGDTIRDSGIDGPYRLKEVKLIDNIGETLPVQEAFDVWITAAYSHLMFGTPRIYIPIIRR